VEENKKPSFWGKIKSTVKEDVSGYVKDVRKSIFKSIWTILATLIFGAATVGGGTLAAGAVNNYFNGGGDSAKLRELVAGVSTAQSKIQSDIDSLQGAIARTTTSVTSLSSQLSIIAGTLQSVTTNQQRASDLIRQNADGLAKINISIGDLKQSLGKFELGLTNLQSNTGQFEDELRKLEETNSKFSGLISK